MTERSGANVITLLEGDCRARLPELAAGRAQTCVTSPPYWGLRDFGLPPSVWGGKPGCRHRWGKDVLDRSRATPGTTATSGLTNGGAAQYGSNRFEKRSQFCVRCGAWLGVLGLEPDPALYLEHIVEVFREVRRVLRPDGTLWLNLGDTYTDGGRGGDQGSTLDGTRRNQCEVRKVQTRNGTRPFSRGRKQLLGMPWRVALALQDDGWYLRSDIIWHKTNPMPQSCTDRPTGAHEYVFLFAKRRFYHYDYVAALEPVTGRAHRRGSGVGPKTHDRMPTGWETGPGRHDGRKGNYTAERTARAQSRLRGEREHRELTQGKNNASFQEAITGLVLQRNRRSVWTIPTSPFRGAHFATFPVGLVDPCLAAGTSPHVCTCGAPWKRIVQKRVIYLSNSAIAGKTPEQIIAAAEQAKGDVRGGRDKRLRAGPVTIYDTIGWTATCGRKCPRPNARGRALVLDPFAGSLTTALAADRRGLDVVAIEANPAYVALGRPRLARQLTIDDAGV